MLEDSVLSNAKVEISNYVFFKHLSVLKHFQFSKHGF
jgi:hypothetical protein